MNETETETETEIKNECSIFGCDNSITVECGICSNNICSRCSLNCIKLCKCGQESSFMYKCPFCNIYTNMDNNSVRHIMTCSDILNTHVPICDVYSTNREEIIVNL